MQLNDRQIQLIDAQIKRMQKTDNYYGNMYKDLGIKGISSQEEFETLPFSSKADLRNAYPLGIQAVPDEEVVRIHSSSGTTGKPVIIPYTKKDVDDWATMFARCYETAGITNKDRIQIDHIHSKLLKIIQLIPYALQISTVEFPDTHRFRILIPILYLIDMLSYIIIFIIKYIVLWSSISKSIHKYLVHDSTLSPRRNLVSRYYTKIIILVKLP